MKKQLLVITIMLLGALAATESYAQFSQGRLLVDGSLRFASSTTENTFSTSTTKSKTTTVGFSPSVGYFVIDNLAVGALVNVSTSRYKSETSNTENKDFATTIGPFVRYYLPVAVFFQGMAAFGSNNFTSIAPVAGEVKTGVTQWGLGVGYAYFLNDFVALEPMVGYQSVVYKSKENDNKRVDGTIYLSAALTIYLGERQ